MRKKGSQSTLDNPGDSQLMRWIRDHLAYKADYCLIWPFGCNSSGYATIGRGGKMFYVHRIICKQVHGDPPSPTHQAAHSCGNGTKGCVNPMHLSWKSPRDNQLDRVEHGTQYARRVQLTPQKVADIRMLLACGNSTKELASLYKVSETTIRHIKSRKTWQNGQAGKGGFAVRPYTREERARRAQG